MPDRTPVPDAPPPPPGWPGPHGALRPPVGAGHGRTGTAVVGTGLASLAIAVYFLGQLVVGLVAGGVLAGTGVTDPSGLDPVLLLAAAVAGQAAGLGAALGLLRARGIPLEDLVGPVRPLGRLLLGGIALGAGLLVTASLLVAALVGLTGSDAVPEQLILDEALSGGARTILAVVAAVLLAPVAEELLFRGLLHRALRRRRGVLAATLLSSALFAVVHLDVGLSQPLALVGLLLVGIVLALAYERTGRLLVPIVAHAAYNGTALLAAVVAQRSGFLDLLGLVT